MPENEHIPKEGDIVSWSALNGTCSGTVREIGGRLLVVIGNGCTFRMEDVCGSKTFHIENAGS